MIYNQYSQRRSTLRNRFPISHSLKIRNSVVDFKVSVIPRDMEEEKHEEKVSASCYSFELFQCCRYNTSLPKPIVCLLSTKTFIPIYTSTSVFLLTSHRLLIPWLSSHAIHLNRYVLGLCDSKFMPIGQNILCSRYLVTQL